MRFGIRGILVVSLVVASALPLAIWATWVSINALDQEIAEVEDRHLLLARNLSRALDRYAQDVAAVFSHVVESSPSVQNSEHLTGLLDSLQFRHICLIEIETKRVLAVSTGSTLSSPVLPPLDEFSVMAEMALGRLVFTNVRANPTGQPAIYLVKKVGPNLMALGELGTGYLQETRKAVSFGVGGHAALVDSSGTVLGHPNATWEAEMKNISKVDAVARMMKGETGVSQFFSPAAKKDMIAGFTTVPVTGWGVMIPQPLEELEARAEEVRFGALLIVLIGASAAAVLGWFVGGMIERPLRNVSAAAGRLAGGDTHVSVPDPGAATTIEVANLTERFNEMAIALDSAKETQTQALRAAEDAIEAKSDFVARVSHELRTPLNSVIGFSGMIRDQAHGKIDDQEYIDYATLIHDSGQNLLELVNDIIAYAKVEGRSDALSESRIDPGYLVEAVVEHRSRDAQELGVAIRNTVGQDHPTIWADEIKLRQALGHVLSNAVKFTREGGEVVLSAALTGNGGFSILVTDTGIGIAEEDIPVALSPFGQISSSLDRSHEGAGLGLPLAKMLVEMHGGTLRVQSKLGEGTTVTLTLPPERIGTTGGAMEN